MCDSGNVLKQSVSKERLYKIMYGRPFGSNKCMRIGVWISLMLRWFHFVFLSPGDIPARATLIYDIELVEMKSADELGGVFPKLDVNQDGVLDMHEVGYL